MVARVAKKFASRASYLISNKREWKNCFIKNSQKPKCGMDHYWRLWLLKQETVRYELTPERYNNHPHVLLYEGANSSPHARHSKGVQSCQKRPSKLEIIKGLITIENQWNVVSCLGVNAIWRTWVRAKDNKMVVIVVLFVYPLIITRKNLELFILSIRAVHKIKIDF